MEGRADGPEMAMLGETRGVFARPWVKGTDTEAVTSRWWTRMATGASDGSIWRRREKKSIKEIEILLPTARHLEEGGETRGEHKKGGDTCGGRDAVA